MKGSELCLLWLNFTREEQHKENSYRTGSLAKRFSENVENDITVILYNDEQGRDNEETSEKQRKTRSETKVQSSEDAARCGLS